MDNFLICVLIGVVLMVFSITIAINTSIGGTRSDYNDGSGVVAGIGAVFFVVGVAGVVLSWLSP